MHSKESHMANVLSHSSNLYENYNISHFEWIRRRQPPIDNKKTCFSNNLLRKNIKDSVYCQQVLRLKLKNDYSPRKQPKLYSNSNSSKRLQSANPYKEAIQQMKNYETVVLGSFKKSINISKKPISDQRGIFASMRQSDFRLMRSKTSLSLHDLKAQQFNQNIRHYEQMILTNPENPKRMVQSAIHEKRPKRTQIRNLSVLNDFKGKISLERGRLG